MPAYVAQSATPLYPGALIALWNEETVAANGTSMAVSLGVKPGRGAPPQVAISISFDSAPTDVIAVQTANVDTDASYVTLTTAESTNTSPDIMQLPVGALFLRLIMVSFSAGGNVTAKIYRS